MPASNRSLFFCSEANRQDSALTKDSRSYRLYFRATFNNPYEGMFSFFPAQPIDAHPEGFARPAIEIPNVIKGNRSQSFTLNELKDLDSVQRYWKMVVEKILDANLKLGVWTKIPEAKP